MINYASLWTGVLFFSLLVLLYGGTRILFGSDKLIHKVYVGVSMLFFALCIMFEIVT